MKSFRLIDKASWLVAMLFNSQLAMACVKMANVEMSGISATPTTTSMSTTTCPSTTGCSVNGIPNQNMPAHTVTLVTSQMGSCPSLAVTCTTVPSNPAFVIVLYSFLGPADQFFCPKPAGCARCNGIAGCPVQCVNGQLMFTDGTDKSQPLVSLNC